MLRGKDLFIMRHNQGTELPVLNVIFRQKAMDISWQKEPQVCGIFGANGQKIQHHLTGKTVGDLKMHGNTPMKAAVLNVMKTFSPQN